MSRYFCVALATLIAGTVFFASEAPAQTSNTSAIQAGVARVDITPQIDELPEPLSSVHDPIYVRALVVESETKRAVIVVAEVPAIAPDIYEDLGQQVSERFRVPREQVMIGTTHTHNSLRVAPPGPSPIPSSEAFTSNVISGTIEAIAAAEKNLQPARAGYAAGQVSLIAGRNEWHEPQKRYIDGIDRTGLVPVDQTFGVYEFATLSGEPIGVILNYGIEPVVYELAKTQVSGDVPGAASRYIEDAFGGKVVALFTIGSPASPAYRVLSLDSPNRGIKTAENIMNSMGVILGEEALGRMQQIKGSTAPLQISAAADSLTCPGKRTTPRNLRGHCAYSEDSDLPACEFTDQPFPDVTLNTGVLRLGDVAYITADANVVPALWEKFRQQSPLSQAQAVGTNFGQFRFVVDDAAYALNTYPATDTRAVVGCAEEGYLESVQGLLEKTR